jgi:hypothetical protein
MPQFQFANVPGQFQQGHQFAAANAQQAENLKQSQFAGKQATDLDALRKNIRSAVELKSVPDDQKAAFLSNKIATGESERRDMTQSRQALELVSSGRFDELNQGTEQLLQVATRMGDIRPVSDGISSEGRTFNRNIAGLSEEDQEKALRIKLRLDPGAVGSATQTIAGSEGLTDTVATSEATIAGAKAEATEGKKLEQQLKHKPAITRAIKLAEAAAKEQGEVLTDLARAKAGMPGLIEATNNLKELAVISTSTLGGRVFDTLVKESGWGSTEGANAKVKFKAIIDNQVLPLLKQIFGGAMTEGEGLRLSNTLGDPDASPEQKMLQIEAFMEHQQRQMETLTRQAEAGEKPQDIQGELSSEDAAIFSKYGI